MIKPLALAAALLAFPLGAAAAQTVKPGMTADEVRAAWGEPFAVRSRGAFTYLLFRSDCLPGCGSHDMVTLRDGRVIDAVARSSGRRYEGTASIDNRTPAFTAPEKTS